MLVEVNKLKFLIIDRPNRDDVDLWISTAKRLSLALLVDENDDVLWWTKRLSDEAVIKRTTRFANDVASNISIALDELDAQPHETAYITTDPYAIAEAANTRVGTILYADGISDTIADLVLEDTATAKAFLEIIAAGKNVGLLNELFSSKFGEMKRVVGSGYYIKQKLLKNRIDLDRNVRRNVDVIVAGRYFPKKDARHSKHQLSMRLLYFKDGDRRGQAVTESLGDLLSLIFENEHFDIVTRVPPRPSKGDDLLGDALTAAMKQAAKEAKAIGAVLSLEAVWCDHDYAPQKGSGAWGNRVANVHDAFEADPEIVAGKRVLLVDDILTSGATISEVARKLLIAGASEVVLCPIAIDQSIVNYSEAEELPCPDEQCNGTMMLRYPRDSDKAFWGCTNYRFDGTGCGQKMWYEAGLKARNERNSRDEIVMYDNEPF